VLLGVINRAEQMLAGEPAAADEDDEPDEDED